MDDFNDFAAKHRRSLPGGDVAFYVNNRACREEEADRAYVSTWRPRGGRQQLEIKLDADGRYFLRHIEYALQDAFEAGKRAQQNAIIEVLGLKS